MRRTIHFSDLSIFGKIISAIEGIAVLGGLITLLLIIVGIME